MKATWSLMALISLENKVEVPELQEMLSQMLTIKKFQG
jgi:hypothetical protein